MILSVHSRASGNPSSSFFGVLGPRFRGDERDRSMSRRVHFAKCSHGLRDRGIIDVSVSDQPQ